MIYEPVAAGSAALSSLVRQTVSFGQSLLCPLCFRSCCLIDLVTVSARLPVLLHNVTVHRGAGGRVCHQLASIGGLYDSKAHRLLLPHACRNRLGLCRRTRAC